MNKYGQLIASGTFDLFHKGHEEFLKKSFEISYEVIVCITSDAYVKTFKNAKGIEDYDFRKKTVEQFLNKEGLSNSSKIIPIESVYGPLLTSQFNPQAIAVTPENKINALKINEKRKNLRVPLLEIEVIGMEKAEDGELISSTRIRNGEINRRGRLYVRSGWNKNKLILPASLRSDLQKPFGKVLISLPQKINPQKTITIGDITAQNFNQKNAGQFLSIVDFKVHREKKFNKLSELGFDEKMETISVENPAGTITPDLFDAVQKAFNSENKKIILVKGEEDLAVLPVLLIAPLGFSIYYGQPDKGMVEIIVNEENKEKAYQLVSKFNS